MNDVIIQLQRGVVVVEVGMYLHANTNPALLPTTASTYNVDAALNVVCNAGSHQNVGTYHNEVMYQNMGSLGSLNAGLHGNLNAGRNTGRGSEHLPLR